MTTLENSYCVPKNSKEWKALLLCNAPMRNLIRMRKRGQIAFLQNTPLLSLMDADKDEFHFGDRKEIPVQHFIDLVEDRISVWRLKEVGFIKGALVDLHVFYTDHGTLYVDSGIVWNRNPLGYHNKYNITTFTDLLTLIKFLTPPTK